MFDSGTVDLSEACIFLFGPADIQMTSSSDAIAAAALGPTPGCRDVSPLQARGGALAQNAAGGKTNYQRVKCRRQLQGINFDYDFVIYRLQMDCVSMDRGVG